MAANVESMMYVRETPWHGLGTRVEEALTSEEAIKQAGLDWRVTQRPLYVASYSPFPHRVKGAFNAIETHVANVRESDEAILGVVSPQYKIVQNQDAFDFTDFLIGEGVRYETAGSLSGGKRTWLLANMPKTEILGDEFIPYLCFSNGFDGKQAIKVCITPVRVVCQNTLNLALRNCKRMWSTSHMGDLQSKLQGAANTLEISRYYMYNLKDKAERLAQQKVGEKAVLELIDQLFPVPQYSTERQENNVMEMRDKLFVVYRETPDLSNFKGTAWGVINAVSDFVGHAKPKRMTATFVEKRFERIVDGDKILDKAYTLLAA